MLHHRVKTEAMRNGLLCYTMGGTIDGKRGNHVLIAPPYTVDESHVDAIATRFADAVIAAMPTGA